MALPESDNLTQLRIVLEQVRAQSTQRSARETLAEGLGKLLGVSRVVEVVWRPLHPFLELSTLFRLPDVAPLEENASLAKYESELLASIEGGKTVAVSSTADMPSAPLFGERLQGLGIQALLIAPLLREPDELCALSFHQCDRPREWTETEKAMVTVAVQHLGDIARYEKLRQRGRLESERRALLHELLDQLIRLTDVEEMAKLVVMRVPVALDLDRCVIADSYPSAGFSVARYEYRRVEDWPPLLGVHPIALLGEEGAEALARGESLHSPDMDRETRWPQLAEFLRSVNVGAMAIQPILAYGEWIAVLALAVVGRPYHWKDDELTFLRAVASQVGYTIANARLKKTLTQQIETQASRQRHYEELIVRAPEMYCLVDQDGRLLDCNQTGLRMLGHSLQDVVARPFTDFMSLTSQQQFLQLMRRLVGSDDILSLDVQLRAGGGLPVLTQLQVAPMRDADESFLGARVLARDMSRQQQLEDRLFQAQRLDSLSMLASGIAHEYNNLFTSALGYLGLAEDSDECGEEAKAHLAMVERSLNRAIDVTAKIRSFVQGDSGSPYEPVDLARVVADAADIVSAALPGDIQLKQEFDIAGAPMVGSGAELQQMTMCLLLNARDALADGGEITVGLRHVQLGDAELREYNWAAPGVYWRLEVGDTGKGLTEEQVRQVFLPYVSGRGSTYGLGMAIAYGIARDHGGLLQMRSVVGHGTTVIAHLPAADATETKSGEPSVELRRGAGQVILVVDDEPAVRQFATDALAAFGYTPLIAVDGVDGVEALRREIERVELVLLDYTMPRMNGLEAFRAMRQIAPGLKVIISTGYADSDGVNAILNEGAVGLIKKPYQLTRLAQAIASALEG